MRNIGTFIRVGALATAFLAFGTPAHASDREFFDNLNGRWTGPGEIVAGKYRGTRFSCTLDGSSSRKTPGMTLDGKCRVGLFSQKINATVKRSGRSYSGTFLDGAKGKGLDVISGNVARDRMTVGMRREQLNGAMVARMKPDGNLGVTVSVRIGEELVPVIGLDLTRVDGTATGSIR